MQVDRPTFSLRWKIVLIVCVTAGLSAVLIAGVNYYSMVGLARQKAIAQLAHTAEIAAISVASQHRQIRNDLFTVSRTVGANRLLEAVLNGGSHPDDAAPLDTVKARLSSTFAGIMGGRPYYTQMRYIGMADNGRELARVNRLTDGSLYTVPTAEMQEKGGEPYFKESLSLPPDSFYVSKVTYSREHGVTDPSLTPTLRTVLPTFTAAGERFGMIVINAHYGQFLKEALRDLPLGYDTYILDRYGDYIRRSPEGHIGAIEISGAYRATPPQLIEDFITGRREAGLVNTSDRIGYYHRFNVLADQRHGEMAVLLLAPRSMLIADANAQVGENLITAFGITAIAGVIAAFLANLHTWPIRRITAAIETFGRRRGRDLDLPVDAADEVGVMARAFRTLVETLEESQQSNKALSLQLDTFILSAVDGIVMTDSKGVIEEINSAALEIFGYERDELIGRNVSVLMPRTVASQHDEYISDYLHTGRQTIIGTIREVEGMRKDGSLVPLELSITEMLLPDQRLIFTGMMRDMSVLHEAQRSVECYMAELERSNHELDQFAYVASHDLKAPLRVIDNASRWLEEDLAGRLTDDDRANMALLRGRVKRMDKLLDDLLEYCRIGKAEDGRFGELTTLAVLVEEVVLLLEPPPAMKIVVPVHFTGITAYRMPLQRVFYNLINNAIKHHDRTGGTIELGVEDDGPHHVFIVKDDGPGIPCAYREQIFEMFRTLKPRDKVEGSGMGLAMVKKIVESLGGAIVVAPGGERGAEFRFTWPKVPEDCRTESTGKAA